MFEIFFALRIRRTWKNVPCFHPENKNNQQSSYIVCFTFPIRENQSWALNEKARNERKNTNDSGNDQNQTEHSTNSARTSLLPSVASFERFRSQSVGWLFYCTVYVCIIYMYMLWIHAYVLCMCVCVSVCSHLNEYEASFIESVLLDLFPMFSRFLSLLVSHSLVRSLARSFIHSHTHTSTSKRWNHRIGGAQFILKQSISNKKNRRDRKREHWIVCVSAVSVLYMLRILWWMEVKKGTEHRFMVCRVSYTSIRVYVASVYAVFALYIHS